MVINQPQTYLEHSACKEIGTYPTYQALTLQSPISSSDILSHSSGLNIEMSEYSQKNHANAKLFPLTHLCAAFADYLTPLSQRLLYLYIFSLLPDRCMHRSTLEQVP